MADCTMCGWDSHRTPKHTWTFECEGYIPSVNQLGSNHKNGFTYRRYRKEHEASMRDGLNAIPRANKFRVVVVTRLWGKGRRRYDRHNMAGGCKALVDVLTGFAVILDDRDDCAQIHHLQERSGDGIDRIRLQILEY